MGSCSGCHHVPNTGEQSLTFLTVYDAPYELPDLAIIHRLLPYCEVAWHRREPTRPLKRVVSLMVSAIIVLAYIMHCVASYVLASF